MCCAGRPTGASKMSSRFLNGLWTCSRIVLFTRGLPPTLRALTETTDTEDPPAIIFTLSNPIESGVAQSACLHAPHITGVEAQSPYAEILPLLMLQNPDLRYIGTIFGSNEAPGVLGARDIVRIGESLGLQVESVGAFAFSDLRDAANRLVDKGVEAIVLPLDNLVVNGTPVVGRNRAGSRHPAAAQHHPRHRHGRDFQRRLRRLSDHWRRPGHPAQRRVVRRAGSCHHRHRHRLRPCSRRQPGRRRVPGNAS